MGDKYKMMGDLHVRMVASEETYMGANMKMTYVGSRGSQMWSDEGGVWGRVEGGCRVGGVQVGEGGGSAGGGRVPSEGGAG